MILVTVLFGINLELWKVWRYQRGIQKS